MAILRLILLLTLSFTTTVISHDITAILNEYPAYSTYNNYLTQTKLADEINRRQTITVLVFNNTIASEYLLNLDVSVVKKALSVHVLLDYFDLPKLQTIGGGSVMTTTLFQTTGEAENGAGFVNITDLVAGKVGFGSGGSGSKLNALYYKSVKQIPYNISVIELTAPIIVPGVLNQSHPLDTNISHLLDKSGCKIFRKLISDTGVLDIYETTEPRGLTVFAPSDEAFNASGLPDFRNLSNNDFISMLLYHAIPVFVNHASLGTLKSPVGTLATNLVQEFDLTVRSDGDGFILDSGVGYSRVVSTVLDSVPLSIFTIDHVLVPRAAGPVPVPETSPPAPAVPVPAPAPVPGSVPGQAPVHGPSAPSPAPVGGISPVNSPPAPPTSAPGSGPAPADVPAADTGNNKSSGGDKAPVMFLALVTVAVSGILSSIVG